jgi:Flp pilus assembly protein TadD
MKRILIALTIVIVVVSFAYFLSRPKKIAQTFTKKDMQDIQMGISRRGEARFKQKAFAPIIATYEGLLKKYPDSVELKKKLGKAYFGAERYADAKLLLEEIAKVDETDGEMFYELGVIAKKNGDTKAAKEYLEKAIKLGRVVN